MKSSQLPAGWVKRRGRSEYRKLLLDGTLLYVIRVPEQGWLLMVEGKLDNAYRTADDAIESAEGRFGGGE